jgi:hypothetical protein
MARMNLARTAGLLLFVCCLAAPGFAQHGWQDLSPILSAPRARHYDAALQLLAPALQHEPNNQLCTLQ